MMVIAAAGLAAGMVHVLAGPDHLAAVAPLAADSDRRRWQSGLLWGVGHTGGVLTIGALALLLRGILPIDAISSWSERLVGFALIGIGLWGARRALASHVHSHVHTHGGSTHAHVHFHASGGHGAVRRPVAHEHGHASFAFGVLHGLAGSAHVLGILPALALPSGGASLAYLISYGVGNVTAMTLFSSAIGLVASGARFGGLRVYQGLLATCSLAAIVVGIAWLVT